MPCCLRILMTPPSPGPTLQWESAKLIISTPPPSSAPFSAPSFPTSSAQPFPTSQPHSVPLLSPTMPPFLSPTMPPFLSPNMPPLLSSNLSPYLSPMPPSWILCFFQQPEHCPSWISDQSGILECSPFCLRLQIPGWLEVWAWILAVLMKLRLNLTPCMSITLSQIDLQSEWIYSHWWKSLHVNILCNRTSICFVFSPFL